jgi:SAM-dependent methyltransferase
MSLKKIARNLGHPRGKLGRRVAGWLAENRPIYEQMLEYPRLGTEDRLLEIGYGPGHGIGMLYDRFRCHIDGIDISRQMQFQAWRNNERRMRGGKIELLLGDFALHDFGERRYDLVCLANVVYFWEALDPYFRKIGSLVRPGASCIVFMGDPENLRKGRVSGLPFFQKHELGEVEACLARHGFPKTRVEAYRREPGAYFVMGRAEGPAS